MNTRQKLTLGIAAIFMVTLTIVGVTYAYFVTRVTGATTESVNVSTATLGDVMYVAGNADDGTPDLITLNDVIPGATVYKSFSVKNTNETVGGTPSYFKIITSNVVPTGAEHFIHSADGKNAGIEATCYGFVGGDLATGTEYSRATQPLMYSETAGEDNATVRSTCFSTTQGSKYNNIRYTLFEVDAAVTSVITEDPEGTVVKENFQTAYNATNEVLYNGTGTGIVIASGNGAPGTVGNSNKDTNSVRHYVLKVEYLDTVKTTEGWVNGSVNGDENQNAENEAGLDITISIEAA